MGTAEPPVDEAERGYDRVQAWPSLVLNSNGEARSLYFVQGHPVRCVLWIADHGQVCDRKYPDRARSVDRPDPTVSTDCTVPYRLAYLTVDRSAPSGMSEISVNVLPPEPSTGIVERAGQWPALMFRPSAPAMLEARSIRAFAPARRMCVWARDDRLSIGIIRRVADHGPAV